MNKNLKKQIEQAKNKAMNFAIVGTASKPSKLLLSKKKISDSEINEAKVEFGGTAVLKGVVQGEGSNLIFQSVDAAAFDAGKLKKLIKEETEMTVSVEFKKVATLAEVDEKEGESAKTEQPEKIQDLTKAFNKLSPLILKAAKEHPNWKDAILKLAKKVQRELSEEDDETANATLIELAHFMKSLDRESQPKGPEPKNAIEAAEQRRKEYIDRMSPRYEVLLETPDGYNLDGYLELKKKLQNTWKFFKQEPIVKQTEADGYEKKQQEMDALFQQVVSMPEKAVKAKKCLVAEFIERRDALDSDFEIVKNAKHNGKDIVDKEFAKEWLAQRKRDPEGWTSEANFTDAEEQFDEMEKKMAEFLKSFAEAKREAAKNGKITLKFNGEVMKEDALTNAIKKHLPQNGYGNISQAMNDAYLGRGKATTGRPGVLHASAGKADAAGGCTLFFERDDDGNVNVVGVGQHKSSASYEIYFGFGMEGKVLSL